MVCMIRLDTTGQQSVCLSSGYCHRQCQEAGQWLPGIAEVEWKSAYASKTSLHLPGVSAGCGFVPLSTGGFSALSSLLFISKVLL